MSYINFDCIFDVEFDNQQIILRDKGCGCCSESEKVSFEEGLERIKSARKELDKIIKKIEENIKNAPKVKFCDTCIHYESNKGKMGVPPFCKLKNIELYMMDINRACEDYKEENGHVESF